MIQRASELKFKGYKAFLSLSLGYSMMQSIPEVSKKGGKSWQEIKEEGLWKE
jgi:hypothetical protein